ncbi:retron St85 family RNA-directed DNA polymerase [Candidatus Neomarinimicrobiota bacterium]
MTPSRIGPKLLGIPPIETLEEFSAITHLSKGLIYRLSRFADSYYKVYPIPKRNGGSRLISQPSIELKALQSWILNSILNQLKVSQSCKGFEKGISILDNAKPHIGASSVLCLDIDDFFPSIKANQVWSVFRTIGYNPRIAAILASLCTYKGSLPQGGPTSPKLANLVCVRLDARLLGYVGKRGIVYTRYADDLTFSSLSYVKLMKTLPFICHIISSEGFKINEGKTRFAGPSRKHKVTGLVVNETRAGIGRKQYRIMRAKLEHFYRHTATATHYPEYAYLGGYISFMKSVDEQRYGMLKKSAEKLLWKRYNPNARLMLSNLFQEEFPGDDETY